MHPTKMVSFTLSAAVLCTGAAALCPGAETRRRCTRRTRGAAAPSPHGAPNPVERAGSVHEAVRGDLEV